MFSFLFLSFSDAYFCAKPASPHVLEELHGILQPELLHQQPVVGVGYRSLQQILCFSWYKKSLERKGYVACCVHIKGGSTVFDPAVNGTRTAGMVLCFSGRT